MSQSDFSNQHIVLDDSKDRMVLSDYAGEFEGADYSQFSYGYYGDDNFSSTDFAGRKSYHHKVHNPQHPMHHSHMDGGFEGLLDDLKKTVRGGLQKVATNVTGAAKMTVAEQANKIAQRIASDPQVQQVAKEKGKQAAINAVAEQLNEIVDSAAPKVEAALKVARKSFVPIIVGVGLVSLYFLMRKKNPAKV